MTLYKFHGVVTSVCKDTFSAHLIDKTDEKMPDSIVEILIDKLDEKEKDYVVEGAQFILVLKYYDPPANLLTKIPIVRTLYKKFYHLITNKHKVFIKFMKGKITKKDIEESERFAESMYNLLNHDDL